MGKQRARTEEELAGEVINPETDPEFGQFLAVQRRSYELTHILVGFKEAEWEETVL